MTNRIFIDAPVGVIEIEGEKEFVEAQLKKLLPLVENLGFGTRTPAVRGTDPTKASAEATRERESGGTSDRKPVKQSTHRPPRGHSCSDRVIVLRSEGFFREHRTPTQILERLAEKGLTHSKNQVTATLHTLIKRQEMQRVKKEGRYVYFWDRE